MRRLIPFGAILGAIIALQGPAIISGQEQTGLTNVETPVYLRPDITLSPLATLPKDRAIEVLEIQEPWLKVAFTDPLLGRRIGYAAAKDISYLRRDPEVRPMAAAPGATRELTPAREQTRAAIEPTSPPAIPSPPSTPPPPTTRSSKYPLTPAAIDAAIDFGSKRKNHEHGLRLLDSGQQWMVALAGSSESSGFSLVVYTPIAWLREQAARAAKEYRRMTLEDVGDSYREAVLRVIVHPDRPNQVSASGMIGASSVQHVVLRDLTRRVAVQPISKDTTSYDVQNAFGAKAAYGGLVAKFTLEGLREVRGPRGDREFLITVIGTTGEEKDFQVKRKHFERLPE